MSAPTKRLSGDGWLHYLCGCMLDARRTDEGSLPARLCDEHAGNLISMLSMNGRYVANHNSAGERLIVVAEPIAVKP